MPLALSSATPHQPATRIATPARWIWRAGRLPQTRADSDVTQEHCAPNLPSGARPVVNANPDSLSAGKDAHGMCPGGLIPTPSRAGAAASTGGDKRC